MVSVANHNNGRTRTSFRPVPTSSAAGRPIVPSPAVAGTAGRVSVTRNSAIQDLVNRSRWPDSSHGATAGRTIDRCATIQCFSDDRCVYGVTGQQISRPYHLLSLLPASQTSSVAAITLRGSGGDRVLNESNSRNSEFRSCGTSSGRVSRIMVVVVNAIEYSD